MFIYLFCLLYLGYDKVVDVYDLKLRYFCQFCYHLFLWRLAIVQG